MRRRAVTLGLVLTALTVPTAGCAHDQQPNATVAVVNVTDTAAFERDVMRLGGTVVAVDARASTGRASFPADRLAQAQRELTEQGYRLVTPAPLPSVPDAPSAPA